MLRTWFRAPCALTLASFALCVASTAPAQQLGPDTAEHFGQGLPRDGKSLLFADDQYPFWNLGPEYQDYAPIDGMRIKEDVQSLSDIALEMKDAGKKWWGRFPGTDQDRAGMKFMTDRFEALGLTIERRPVTLPEDWRAVDWSLSYEVGGQTIDLATAFPVSGTGDTAGKTMTAEAVWVGLGTEADFKGKDVAGKAVVIYSYFAPGGRSHSASDRTSLTGANTLAMERGAAMIINVMNIPGNGQFQPEGAIEEIPQLTLSMDEGFPLRDALAGNAPVTISYNLEAEQLKDVETELTIATLPGASDEQILILSHTDGYFQAAMDNNAGMASALELARFFSEKPQADRPRTLVFVQFPDHHHGEVAMRAKDVGFNDNWDWDKVAMKLTMEHPSQTLLFLYNDSISPTNSVGAFRWSAIGSPAFEQMVFDTLKDFGVSVYSMEDTPKNGAFAPGFHIIDHVIYHTSLDIPELVPAAGLQNATQAFAAIVDKTNAMTIEEIRGESFPPENRRGTLVGTEQLDLGN